MKPTPNLPDRRLSRYNVLGWLWFETYPIPYSSEAFNNFKILMSLSDNNLGKFFIYLTGIEVPDTKTRNLKSFCSHPKRQHWYRSQGVVSTVQYSDPRFFYATTTRRLLENLTEHEIVVRMRTVKVTF